MRFQSRGRSNGESLARNQRRMTLIVAGVGLVVILLTVSGRSRFLLNAFSGAPDSVPTPPAISKSLLGTNALRSDEFLVVPTEANEIASKYSSMLDRQGIAEMESDVPVDITGPAVVPALLTRTIRDDVIGVLSSEMAAWFGTLRMSQKLKKSDLATLPEAQYSLFMDSPHSCRGRAFVLRGQLRRLTPVAINQSSQSFGLKTAYDAWISTRDSGNQLVHVVAASADDGLPNPEADGVDAPDVEMTGYFFKREGYAAKGKTGEGELGLTALFLAGRIQYLPPQTIVSRASEMTPWLTWIGLGVCGCVLVLVWQFQIADTRFRESRSHQLTVLPVRASFENVEVQTVHEALREMQEYARSTTPDAGLLT